MAVQNIDIPALKQRMGRIGVWNDTLSREPATFEREAAAEIENLGYGALWIGENPLSKEALAHSSILLQATERLMVATGIANIWVRDATAAENGANALTEASGGRFVLGLGVSHAPLVTVRGHDYGRPIEAMRSYLDAMDATEYEGPRAEPAPRILAALRPRMLKLSAERTAGAHTYFVTPLHTSRARRTLGPAAVLAVEQALVLETDPERARTLARKYMAFYLALPNYRHNLLELGWDEEAFENGGTDALVDAIVVWGGEETVAERVQAHLDAGADHVCVQPITEGKDNRRLLEDLRRLAPVLIER
jgi:probable F420-dependent oxidoreductase